MSPLARSFLALAAATLLLGASADPQCTTVKGGSDGSSGKDVGGFHLVQTDSVTDLPPDQCVGDAAIGPMQVGVVVTACDPYGAAPQVALLDDDQRVRVTCAWTNGQQCPQGIDVGVQQRCIGTNTNETVQQ